MLLKLLLAAAAVLALSVVAVAGGILGNRVSLTEPPGLAQRLRVFLGNNVAETGADALFPELRPILLSGEPDILFERLVDACRQLGWDPVAVQRQDFKLHAVVVTPLLRFRDDVLLQLSEVDRGVVELRVRSSSRVGRGDLGANLRHIIDLRTALDRAGLTQR